jgi:hypothetical protein
MWMSITVNFVIGDTKNQPAFGAQNFWKISDQRSVTGGPAPIWSDAPMDTWVNGGRWEPPHETEHLKSPWTTNICIPRGVISYIFRWDRKDSDWKVPLVFRPPNYPPSTLKTANIQQSSASKPLSGPPQTSTTSKGGETAPPPFRPEWGPVVGTAKDCSLCAKGKCSTQQKDEWMPASAHNSRGRRGQATVRLTSTEETDHISAAASLPMGIPKRRRAKARVYTRKSQAMELQSQTSSSFFRP